MKYFRYMVSLKRKFGYKGLFICGLNHLGLVDSWYYRRTCEKYYKNLSAEGRKKELEDWYYYKKGEKLNLEKPQNFDQKMQWLKLYDTTPLKAKLADKYLVREWIKEKIGEEYLISILGVWDSFEEIDFNKLPNQFVLKANHGSGMNIIVTDKEKMNLKKVKKNVDNWMKTTFGWNGMELQYIDIPRKIIAEEYIEQMDGNLLDYKFFCFHGEPKLILMIGNRDIETGTGKSVCVDTMWKRKNFLKGNYTEFEEIPEQPKCFNEMMKTARKLSKGFAFVRVDLYVIEDEIKFGEMTFTPNKGIGQWENEKDNYMIGDWIDLEKLKDDCK